MVELKSLLLYIMNNSTLVKKDDDTFVIYGVIHGLKPKFIIYFANWCPN